LSSYVNLGFTNSWFINGSEFGSTIGTTTGNHGLPVPFNVANVADTSGQDGNNNFWFGLWGGAGNQLFGSPLSLTIPVSASNTMTVYTLTDNTFGLAGNTEFSVTFTGTGGSITDNYVGANNVKDYNLNCATTGCDATPNAGYWFVDASGAQWLQIQAWTLPASFGLSSIMFNQIDGVDGAIVAGVTLSSEAAVTIPPSSAIPEASTWAMMLVGFAGLGWRPVGARKPARRLPEFASHWESRRPPRAAFFDAHGPTRQVSRVSSRSNVRSKRSENGALRRSLYRRCDLLHHLADLRLADDERRGQFDRVARNPDHDAFLVEGMLENVVAA
jgi:hypothetical protein